MAKRKPPSIANMQFETLDFSNRKVKPFVPSIKLLPISKLKLKSLH